MQLRRKSRSKGIRSKKSKRSKRSINRKTRSKMNMRRRTRKLKSKKFDGNSAPGSFSMLEYYKNIHSCSCSLDKICYCNPLIETILGISLNDSPLDINNKDFNIYTLCEMVSSNLPDYLKDKSLLTKVIGTAYSQIIDIIISIGNKGKKTFTKKDFLEILKIIDKEIIFNIIDDALQGLIPINTDTIYKKGDRVEFDLNGTWTKGVIKSKLSTGNRYDIDYISTTLGISSSYTKPSVNISSIRNTKIIKNIQTVVESFLNPYGFTLIKDEKTNNLYKEIGKTGLTTTHTSNLNKTILKTTSLTNSLYGMANEDNTNILFNFLSIYPYQDKTQNLFIEYDEIFRILIGTNKIELKHGLDLIEAQLNKWFLTIKYTKLYKIIHGTWIPIH